MNNLQKLLKMTNTNKIKKAKKYTIDKYINSNTRNLILKHLNISNPTLWRKANILVGQDGGFEICELKQIADILERDILDLLTMECKIYFGFANDKLIENEK